MATKLFANKSLGALWKQGWHEIPEIMGSTALALIGLGMASVGIYNCYYVNGGDYKKYRMRYVVYRPDDPKAERVLKEANSTRLT